MIEIKHKITGKILWKNDKIDTLRGLNLRYVNLRYADLRDANLSGANLRGANLCGANLRDADLRDASLRDADLHGANLRSANLRDADLGDADLRNADLRNADLSHSKGLICASGWLAENFKSTEEGYIVYKRIGKIKTEYPVPDHWKVIPGSILKEVPNPLPTVECGSGVNFGTLKWCKKRYTKSDLWKCLIRWQWLADVVVPYNTDGKARCAWLELVEKIDENSSC